MKIVNFRKNKDMFIAKKIITARQMKTVKVKDVSQGRQNTVMKEFREKGGASILKNRKVYQKQFWNALREDSKERKNAGGSGGFTKKDLEDFFAKKLNDKDDNFSDRKVKKIFTKVYDLKRGRIMRKAAEMKRKDGAVDHQKETQAKVEENKKRDAEIRSHINEIINRSKEKSRAGSLSVQSGNKQQVVERKPVAVRDDAYQKTIATRFAVSDSNLMRSQQEIYEKSSHQKEKNKSQAFGQILFLKNRQHDYVGEQDAEVEQTKARLARIQGESEDDEDKKEL